MDPFKQFFSPEECSSSESGWTSYLASPMEEDYGCSEENYNSNHNDVYDGEGNSDDSMVSDASSALSHHHQNKQMDGQGSHGKYNSSKHSSRKEAKKETRKSSENSSKSKKGLGSQAKSRK